MNNTASEIILPIAGSVTELAPAGKGAYDFNFDATTLRVTTTGRYVLGFDRWCGTNVEGECYRRFVMEVSAKEAAELVLQANDSASWVADWIDRASYEGRNRYRASAAPVWMRGLAA